MCYRFWEQVTVPKRTKRRNIISLREFILAAMIVLGALVILGGIFEGVHIFQNP